ncbi:hypothetical protein [uncultured Gammaproteobacteria bacterium]|nr:hypothetical protein [uncultured Gammaproteobacteria bacterium]
MKILFLFVFINTYIMADINKYIDFDVIESYKKSIIMPAKYLEVFNVAYKDFSSNKNHKIENYIVNISEKKDLYIIKFSIPWNPPVAGGGFGVYHIDKYTMEIIKVKFYK